LDEKATSLRERLIRNFKEAPRERFVREPRYDSLIGALSEGTAARKLGCGIDTVAPGKQSCPYHFHHAQEEMFIILEGSGTLRVAGELLPIGAGDVIFIPPGPDYPHHILNSSDAELKYISISTQERPEICEYPDSGKLAASPARNTWLIQRRENSLDYWDGEA
jgi:uncharacterized cupin superfamily protein